MDVLLTTFCTLFLVVSVQANAYPSTQYDNCIYINSAPTIKLHWTTSSDKSSINFFYEAESPLGWTALGISVDGTMDSGGPPSYSDGWVIGCNSISSDACYSGNSNGGCVGDLYIQYHDAPVWDTTQSLTSVSVGKNSTLLWAQFTRKLNTGDAQDRKITYPGSNTMIWSMNKGLPAQYGALGAHSIQGSFLVDFSQPSVCGNSTTTQAISPPSTSGSSVAVYNQTYIIATINGSTFDSAKFTSAVLNSTGLASTASNLARIVIVNQTSSTSTTVEFYFTQGSASDTKASTLSAQCIAALQANKLVGYNVVSYSSKTVLTSQEGNPVSASSIVSPALLFAAVTSVLLTHFVRRRAIEFN